MQRLRLGRRKASKESTGRTEYHAGETHSLGIAATVSWTAFLCRDMDPCRVLALDSVRLRLTEQRYRLGCQQSWFQSQVFRPRSTRCLDDALFVAILSRESPRHRR